MRIALITRRFPPECCGVGDFTYRLAQALQARGHEVVIFTAPAPGPRPHGMRIVELPLDGWRDLSRLARAIRAGRPDRVQIEYSGYAWSRWGFAFWVNALVHALRRARLPVTVALHETYIRIRQHPLRLPVSLLQRLHIGLFLAAADEVLLNMPERVSTLRRWIPWRRQRIQYRPNASNIPVAPLDARAREELRARHGAGPGDFVVAMFGNFASAKNYQAVIEAVALLRAGLPLRVWLLGDWAGADTHYITLLRDRARLLGLENEVFWSGFLPAADLSAHLQSADLFVLPQADGHLTRSGAFMAAAAHGLPVIAVRNPENQGEFVHGAHVWLVARSRAADFAEAIRTLAADAPLRNSLGNNLHRLYEERFDWRRIAHEIILRVEFHAKSSDGDRSRAAARPVHGHNPPAERGAGQR